MKLQGNLDKALIVGGLALLVFSGGVARAAMTPADADPAVAALYGTDPAQLLGNGPGGPGQFNSAAATYIGITETALRDELTQGKSLAEVAVAHGKTRDGLIAALTQAESQRIAQLVDQKGVPGRGPGPGPGPRGFGFGVGGDSFAAAATYLGITQADLRTKTDAGQTLAAIANATAGKNRAGLIAAMVADAKAKIDQAQRDGKITADQATQLNSGLTDRVTRLVDANRPEPHRGP